MESLRDVRRVMEREVKKGSCPLMFERIEFGGTPFQLILSEEKLDRGACLSVKAEIFPAVCGKDGHQQRVYGFGYALQKAAV